MTNHFKRPAFSMAILAVFSASLTQAASLQEVYKLAVNSDPLLQQAALQLETSKESILQAKARLIPTVDGQLIADWEDDSDTQSNNSKGYSVNLNQPLYSPALRSAYNKVKIFDRQAQLAFKQSEQDLILRTVNAYIDTMIAKSSLTTTQAQERSIKQRLDRVNAEFEVGVIAITDVHEAKASYDNAKVKVIIVTEQLRSHSAPYRHLHRRY